MERPLGTCCKCGDEICPYDRDGEDWLCKQCFYETLWRGERQPTPRRNGTRIPTPYERKQQDKWKDTIHDKIDRENMHRPAKDGINGAEAPWRQRRHSDVENAEDEFGCANIPSRLPKRPLIGSGYAKN